MNTEASARWRFTHIDVAFFGLMDEAFLAQTSVVNRHSYFLDKIAPRFYGRDSRGKTPQGATPEMPLDVSGAAVTGGESTAIPPVEIVPFWQEILASVLGFSAYGLLVGVVTALSKKEGSGIELLNGSFAFVGGVLLTYAGFRFRASTTEAPLFDVRKVGAALAAFGFGAVLGIYCGLCVKLNRFPGLVIYESSQPTTSSTDAGASVIRDAGTPVDADLQPLRATMDDLQLQSRTGCQELMNEVQSGEYNAVSDVAMLREQLNRLARCVQ